MESSSDMTQSKTDSFEPTVSLNEALSEDSEESYHDSDDVIKIFAYVTAKEIAQYADAISRSLDSDKKSAEQVSQHNTISPSVVRRREEEDEHGSYDELNASHERVKRRKLMVETPEVQEIEGETPGQQCEQKQNVVQQDMVQDRSIDDETELELENDQWLLLQR